MSADQFERSADRIAELAGRGFDLAALWEAFGEVLDARVPHFMAPCWYTLDPHSLLITSHVQPALDELPAAWLEQEYGDDDVNKLADVAVSATGVSTLHDATNGDPASSPRWHENMRYGGDQELIAALRLSNGQAWGAVGLYREPSAPTFSADEVAFLRRVSADLATGARRALLVGRATDPDGPDHDPLLPGLVVVDENGEAVSMTAAASGWLERLPEGLGPSGVLPASVRAVAARARNTRRGDDRSPSVNVPAGDGQWVALHGAVMPEATGTHAVVVIEPAHPARIASLLMAAYQLTDRECDVTRLVLKGAPTALIASELGISSHTVQEHLKRIFDKTGVHSRRELVATVFFSFYEPRLRDNEHRTRNGQPILGDPWLDVRPMPQSVADAPRRRI